MNINSNITLYVVLTLLLFSINADAEENNNHVKNGRSLMALPVLGYTTDTGVIGGAAVLKSYNRDRKRLSTIKAFTTYTKKKQFSIAFEVDHYFSGDRDRVLMTMGYVKYPTTFYGFGNNTDNDEYENYTPEYFESTFFYERRIFQSFKIKTGLLLHSETLLKYKENGIFISSYIPWKKGRFDAGPDFSVIWDSRDNTIATLNGSLVQIIYRGLIFHDDGGSGNMVRFDARKFLNPYSDVVFAFMGMAEEFRGDVPFYMLPVLGGQDRLRGYEENRFRDRSRLLFQHDFRFPLFGPFGGCIFAATGRVGPDTGSLFSGTWHSAFGSGFRWYFNKEDNLVIRLDFARGNDNNGVYIGFGEAF
ncbi:MAG: hypothetical protein JXB48_23875 [Candidatus Latescibacteria bacterium]|nr:hypothetical protein [Candidatus Latescibacterota bacterium]